MRRLPVIAKQIFCRRFNIHVDPEGKILAEDGKCFYRTSTTYNYGTLDAIFSYNVHTSLTSSNDCLVMVRVPIIKKNIIMGHHSQSILLRS